MTYNIDFLISALIFLILILYHFMSQHRIRDFHSRTFLVFIVIGFADIMFDILCTILMSVDAPELAGVTKMCLTVFYLLQVSVPYALLCYTQTLRNCSIQKKKRFLIFWLIPTIVMAGVTLLNVWKGYFFYFSPDGHYFPGPFYIAMYIYAEFYALALVYSSIVHYKELGKRKAAIIWEFLMIMAVCVAIQACFHHVLMTGFGIGMGIMVLFLTLNNPYECVDSLTGAFDNRYFTEWIQQRMDKGSAFHVITVDLVQLKRINTVFGNSFGDYTLVQTAKMLCRQSGAKKVFRVGAKRFLVVVDSLYEYEECRNTVRTYFRNTFMFNGVSFFVPVIICGVVDADKLKERDTLLGYIEYLTSLATSKEEVFLVQGDELTLKGFFYEKEIERFLKTAIEEDLFEVYYQPVYSTKTKGYITIEALSRLRHPSLGPVSPELFIGLAEKNGQIAEIGYQQFRKVCRFIKQNEFIMDTLENAKFNISPAELIEPDYAGKIIETIREFELPPSFFQFEITETVATEYSETLFEIVEEFGKAGIGLCLDDFGSGYANLNTVLRLPFLAIKLDRSLLSGIEEDMQVAMFYQNMVVILQNMGFSVIAEGVETENELRLVSEWGVNMVQGYYFSKPIDAEALLELIRTGKQM